MGIINRFRDRGFELKVKEDEIKFEHRDGEKYIFDLKNEKVKTNVMWTSDQKTYDRLIKDFKKEFGWNE